MLQHVTLEVRPERVRECVSFWALLGFAEMVAPPTLRDRFTWVEREGTQIHLVPLEDPVAMREGHVAVIGPDYDTVLRAIAGGGVGRGGGSKAGGPPRGRSCAPRRGI